MVIVIILKCSGTYPRGFTMTKYLTLNQGKMRTFRTHNLSPSSAPIPSLWCISVLQSTRAWGEIQFFVYVNHSIDSCSVTMQYSDHCLKASLLVKPQIPMVSELMMDSGYESETFSFCPG